MVNLLTFWTAGWERGWLQLFHHVLFFCMGASMIFFCTMAKYAAFGLAMEISSVP